MDESGRILAENHGGILLQYLYDESGAPIGIIYNGTRYMYEKNLQGDIVAILDSTGTAVVSYAYDAWGNVSWFYATNYNLHYYSPFRYRGYYYDQETGFYYLQSRYYDPALGRLINADSHVNANGDIIGFNMYAYCSNNPVMYVDPSGEEAIVLTFVLIAVAAVLLVGAAAVSIASQDAINQQSEQYSDLGVAELEKVEIEDPRQYTVYYLADDTGTIQYVGRTKNLQARLRQHEASGSKTAHLKLHHCYTNLTWEEARGIEQLAMVHYHTLSPKKTVGGGLNWINGMSPLNKYRQIYINAAWDYLYNFATNEYYNFKEVLNL